MRHIRNASLAVLVILGGATPALAQSGGSRIRAPIRQPVTSPYLNLLRDQNNGGGGFGFNYFQRVRPQLDYLETSQRLSNSLSRVQRQQTALQRQLNEGRTPTGHTTSFLNYGGYYQQTGR